MSTNPRKKKTCQLRIDSNNENKKTKTQDSKNTTQIPETNHKTTKI